MRHSGARGCTINRCQVSPLLTLVIARKCRKTTQDRKLRILTAEGTCLLTSDCVCMCVYGTIDLSNWMILQYDWQWGIDCLYETPVCQRDSLFVIFYILTVKFWLTLISQIYSQDSGLPERLALSNLTFAFLSKCVHPSWKSHRNSVHSWDFLWQCWGMSKTRRCHIVLEIEWSLHLTGTIGKELSPILESETTCVTQMADRLGERRNFLWSCHKLVHFHLWGVSKDTRLFLSEISFYVNAFA